MANQFNPSVDPNNPGYTMNSDPNGGYAPVQVNASPSDASLSSYNTAQNQYLRPTSSFTNDTNQGVKEQSNLMGPSDSDTPMNAALDARARQSYGSQVNSMMTQAQIPAAERQNQQYGTAIQNQAAMFQSYQSRAQFNYQQLAFQRAAAIKSAAIQQQLLGQLFGGAGTLAGGALAKSLDDSSWKMPNEMSAPQLTFNDGGMGRNPGVMGGNSGGGGNYSLGSNTQLAYNNPFME